ncbi:hypothetical protein RB195_006668 [Necator americanus]|uniref:Uncharacterized protein n=1 Tax=Necator americanus TaxID=51031 RepID=A0ABR1BWE4_NECAM
MEHNLLPILFRKKKWLPQNPIKNPIILCHAPCTMHNAQATRNHPELKIRDTERSANQWRLRKTTWRVTCPRNLGTSAKFEVLLAILALALANGYIESEQMQFLPGETAVEMGWFDRNMEGPARSHLDTTQ